MLKGLSIPVGVSWFSLSFANGDQAKRFVVSTDAIATLTLSTPGPCQVED